MGVRSDVVVAVKMDAFNRLPNSTQKWLRETSHDVHWACDLKDGVDFQNDGIAFRWGQVKWYTGDCSELNKLYDDLSAECEDEEYLIISACSEYPAHDDDDRGAWYENPWEFYKCTSCTVEGVV